MKHSRLILSFVVLVFALGVLVGCTIYIGEIPTPSQPSLPGNALPPPAETPPVPGMPPTPEGYAQPVLIVFSSDRANIKAGECAVLRWEVQGGFEVLLNEQVVNRYGEQQVCPQQTAAFQLAVDLGTRMERREVVVRVEGAGQSQSPTQGPPPAPPTQQPPPPPQPQPQPQPPAPPLPSTASDLAVTDLYPDNLPLGKVFVRITNNGPATVTQAAVPLACTSVASGSTTTMTKQGTVTVSLSPGQTAAFDTAINVNTSQGAKFKVTCTITPSNDPTAGNNSYSEEIWQPTTPTVISADLVVSDLYPQNLPKGDVFARITNNGPDSLSNASVNLACTAVKTNYSTGAKTTVAKDYPVAITLSLKPGETKAHNTMIVIDTTSGWYDFSCRISSASDPKPANNSYSEKIPPPP